MVIISERKKGHTFHLKAHSSTPQEPSTPPGEGYITAERHQSCFDIYVKEASITTKCLQ